jgi:hypothetical protein
VGGGPVAGRVLAWKGKISQDTRYQQAKRSLARLGRAISDGNLNAFMASWSPNATQDIQIFRNGFLDDLQRGQSTTISLDFEINRFNFSGSSSGDDTVTMQLRVLLVANGAAPLIFPAQLLFDRASGYRLQAWMGQSPFGRNDSQTQSQVAVGDPNAKFADSYRPYFFGSSGVIAFMDTGSCTSVSGGVIAMDFDRDNASHVVLGCAGLPASENAYPWVDLNLGTDMASGGAGFLTSPGEYDFQVPTNLGASGFAGVARVKKCPAASGVHDVSAVNPAAFQGSDLDFVSGLQVGVEHAATYAYRTEEGRFGVVELRVTRTGSFHPATHRVEYQYRTVKVPGDTVLDSEASVTCP